MSNPKGKYEELKSRYKKNVFRHKNIQQRLLGHIKRLEESVFEYNDMKKRFEKLEDTNMELSALYESEKKVTEELEKELLGSSKSSGGTEDRESLLEDIEVKSSIMEEQQEEIDVLTLELETKEETIESLKEQMKGVQNIIKTMKESHKVEIEKIATSPRTSLDEKGTINPSIQKIKKNYSDNESRRKTIQEEQILNELDLSFEEEEESVMKRKVSAKNKSLPRPTISTLRSSSPEKKVEKKKVLNNNPVLPSISSLTLAQDPSQVEQGLHRWISRLEEEMKQIEGKHNLKLKALESRHKDDLQRKDVEQAALEKQLMKARDERVMTQLKLEKIKDIQIQQQQIMANIIEKEKNQLSRTHKKVFKRGIMTLKEIQKQIVDENADLKKSNFVLMKRLNEVKEIEGNIRFMKISLSEKEDHVNQLNESLRKKDLLIKHENCGFLRKEGGRIKNLKWRWFKFDAKGFSYFKEKGDKKPLGVVLKNQKGAPFKVLKNVEGGNDLMFGILAPDSRVYRCEAASSSEKIRWLIFFEDWVIKVNK